MNRSCVLTILMFLSACAAQQQQPLRTAQTADYRTQGNLAANTSPACLSLDQANNRLTPADLYPDMRACVVKNDYNDAADLFGMAGVYGRFDAARVSDQTAHQATQVLLMDILQDRSDAEKQGFSDALKKRFAAGSASLAATCAQLRKIGMPDYYPTYMIQHGMNAMMSALSGKPSADDGLVKGFDARSAWANALGYLHCPSS